MKLKNVGLSKKLAAIIGAFTLVLSATIGVIGYRTFSSANLERYTEFAVAIMRIAESYIDADDMLICFETGVKCDVYMETQEALNNLKEQSGIAFLYFFRVVDGQVVYYINAFTKEEEVEFDYINTLLDKDHFGDELMERLAVLTEFKVIINVTEWGYMLSAFDVIKNSDGEIIGILGSDVDMLNISTERRTYVIKVLIGAFVLWLFLTFLLFSYLRKKITDPIESLSKNVSGFVNSDSKELKPIVSGIKTGNEIEALADSFDKMTVDMLTHIANLTAVTAEKERIGAELDVANKIQASMLPNIFPAFPERDEFDIYANMQPAKEVGGDFYDLFLIDENTLAVVMADVSGKGVPAALFMVIAKTLIKNNAQNNKTPKEVFEIVNNLLCEGNEANMFVTAFMGYLNIKSGKFTFVNAGHNPPLLRRANNKNFEWLKAKAGFVLAGMEDMFYTQGEITLQKGDEIFLYTDGVTEAVNMEEQLFSEATLIEAANKHIDLPLREFIISLKREIDKFADGAEQADDITMLMLRYIGG
ncbi:MAG: serine/threonine-protein phosphatase [Oscillospiraceae bacterium]|nr:serine/threonine-protein phosphatase [Oscillospiraceae bacterium]